MKKIVIGAVAVAMMGTMAMADGGNIVIEDANGTKKEVKAEQKSDDGLMKSIATLLTKIRATLGGVK